MTRLREGEPPFADDELLYRRLRAEWIDAEGNLLGEVGGPYQPVELPALSVDRQRFAATPAISLSRATLGEVAIAAVSVADVPEEFRYNDKVYEAVVAYDPTPTNDAHAEIRVRLQGATEPSKPKSPAFKSLIRDRIAARMRVVYRR